MDVSTWLTILERLGFPLAVLLAALYTGARGVWVWGHHHRAMMTELMAWRELAMRLGATTEEAIKAANAARAEQRAKAAARATLSDAS